METDKNIVCIIQARTGSTRFPRKILYPLLGNLTVLDCCVERIKMSKLITDIIIAMPKGDESLRKHCREKKYKYFQGEEEDILSRVASAIPEKKKEEKIIIDITSDCPLVDAIMIDRMLEIFLLDDYDYLSNVVTRSWPDGFDIQIYTESLLKEASSIVESPSRRQHSGWNILDNLCELQKRSKFMIKKIGNYTAPDEFFFPQWGLTLDSITDYHLLAIIFAHFNRLDFTAEEIISYLEKNLYLLDMNKYVQRRLPGVKYG